MWRRAGQQHPEGKGWGYCAKKARSNPRNRKRDRDDRPQRDEKLVSWMTDDLLHSAITWELSRTTLKGSGEKPACCQQLELAPQASAPRWKTSGKSNEAEKPPVSPRNSAHDGSRSPCQDPARGFIAGVQVRLTETKTGVRKGYHRENQLFCCEQTNSVACLAWHSREGTRHFPSEELCSYFQPPRAPRPEDTSYTWVFSALGGDAPELCPAPSLSVGARRAQTHLKSSRRGEAKL
ncbi:uncharacterized protein LOC141917498 [Strix aluco]|uniref:uncharacterized protein LOC141917498 n=1 Tax=Strix aluco TaxID=111821 RepID=UPI003DA48F65